MELEKTGAELTPEETERLAEHRRKKIAREKLVQQAATDPEAVERYENYLVTRRESYHRKKQEAERTA